MSPIDPIEFARTLVRCPSVTPKDEGALAAIEASVKPLGFACHRLPFSEPGTPDVDNLYARIGTQAPHFCFAGHSDVVPVGDRNGWSVDPFGAEIVDGVLYGRGTADMKGAIAAFAAAASEFLARRDGKCPGSISLLVTGDEEGPSINGTAKMLRWLAARNERIDACVVGEPTNERQLGDMAKIGRRGSMNARLVVHGRQGHVGYPHLADNPNHRLVQMLTALLATPLDEGSAHFQPSSLQITSIDVGNPATNVIPSRAGAAFNIRFNDLHTSDTLKGWIGEVLRQVGGEHALAFEISGESFLTPPGALSDLVCDAVESIVGRRPALSTTGGTSDARFIRNYSPVIEFGLVGQTMHKVDERAALDDIRSLAAIYHEMLERYFDRR